MYLEVVRRVQRILAARRTVGAPMWGPSSGNTHCVLNSRWKARLLSGRSRRLAGQRVR